RQRLMRDRRQRRAHQVALTSEASDTFGDVGMIDQIRLDFGAALRLERMVDIGVEIILGDRPMVHVTLRKGTTLPGAPATPSISCCSLSRARDRRDITVPTGTFNALAASA